MRYAHAYLLTTVALVSAFASLVACALDFDRYISADSESESGASTFDSPLGIADASSDEASPEASRADGPGEVQASEATAPCSAPAMCYQQAASCGAACAQNYQTCARRCGDANSGCAQPCTSARQSCLGRCATSCIGCTQDAGCSAANDCLDATNS